MADAARGTSETPLLEVRGATKRFPGVLALDDVQLELRKGEVLALVGENGAGKSTLMKLLSGIYTPDAGEFRLDGEPVEFTSPKQAQELGISIIHQELNLMPDLTVAQNIFIGREPRWGGWVLSERALNAATRKLLARLHLNLEPTRLVGSLSIAQQQMVEIAKALSYNARVLILDEPTAALNDGEVEALFDMLRHFVSPSTAAVYISHRMQELARISDRITVLRDGQYVGTVETADASTQTIISMMVGRKIAVDRRPDVPERLGPTVLSVEGLSTRDLLDDISFDLRGGEILGFAGLMGAGRTELARAIIGADRTTAGTIKVHGEDVAIHRPSQAAAAGIGYLSEDRKKLGVLVDRNVRENVAISSLSRFARAAGVVDTRAIDAVTRVQIETLRIKTPSTTQLVKYLSGGNQQKVAIAKWLVRDCDILIFDEPTRGIDVGAKEEIYALVESLAAKGKGIMVISSDLPEVLRMSHRIAVMCEGSLTGILANADATQEKLMELATFRSDESVVSQ